MIIFIIFKSDTKSKLFQIELENEREKNKNLEKFQKVL